MEIAIMISLLSCMPYREFHRCNVSDDCRIKGIHGSMARTHQVSRTHDKTGGFYDQ